MCSSVASTGANTSAGFPTTWARKKITVTTSHSTITPSRSRRSSKPPSDRCDDAVSVVVVCVAIDT